MEFKGLLFDLDGTLVDSNAAVDRAWRTWGQRHGIDIDEAFKIIHGRPAKDSIRILLAGQSEQIIGQEIDWLEQTESTDVADVTPLPGSIRLLEELNALSIPWAIVTSGALPVATARIKAAGLPMPKLLITPEQVSRGKPDPEPYLLGAEKLGLAAQDCIVFEDAPTGIAAGIASRAQVVAILSHFTQQDLPQAAAYIQSMEDVAITVSAEGYGLTVQQ